MSVPDGGSTMRLGVIDHAAETHVGQVRRSNEDSHLVASPLYVVADGMGGARAGEVASAICVEVFRSLPDPLADPEASLAKTIREANHRIWERAQNDTSVAGMGTTVTAAVVSAEGVSFGHVGDSRAYLMRGETLRQLSDDHSLVGELVRRGALTPEEAERHPQRSIITRALGAESDVEPDVWTLRPEEGDLFLLCSDGLSGMVADPGLQHVLATAPSCAEAARALIAAANENGGEDNVTAVLFRIGLTDGPPPPLHADAPTVLTEAPTVTRPAIRCAPPEKKKRRFWRSLVVGLVAAAVVAGGAVAALLGLRWAHFVGASDDGYVAVFQGVPVDVGHDIRLYRQVAVTGTPVAILDAGTRQRLFDHELVSGAEALRRAHALDTLRPWEAPGAEAPAAATTAPAATAPAPTATVVPTASTAAGGTSGAP